MGSWKSGSASGRPIDSTKLSTWESIVQIAYGTPSYKGGVASGACISGFVFLVICRCIVPRMKAPKRTIWPARPTILIPKTSGASVCGKAREEYTVSFEQPLQELDNDEIVQPRSEKPDLLINGSMTRQASPGVESIGSMPIPPCARPPAAFMARSMVIPRLNIVTPACRSKSPLDLICQAGKKFAMDMTMKGKQEKDRFGSACAVSNCESAFYSDISGSEWRCCKQINALDEPRPILQMRSALVSGEVIHGRTQSRTHHPYKTALTPSYGTAASWYKGGSKCSKYSENSLDVTHAALILPDINIFQCPDALATIPPAPPPDLDESLPAFSMPQCAELALLSEMPPMKPLSSSFIAPQDRHVSLSPWSPSGVGMSTEPADDRTPKKNFGSLLLRLNVKDPLPPKPEKLDLIPDYGFDSDFI